MTRTFHEKYMIALGLQRRLEHRPGWGLRSTRVGRQWWRLQARCEAWCALHLHEHNRPVNMS